MENKLETAGYKVTKNENSCIQYEKVAGNRKASGNIPADFNENNWAVAGHDSFEDGRWYCENYGDFPASQLDEVIAFDAEFLGGAEPVRHSPR